MKKFWGILCLSLLLTGCSGGGRELQQAMDLRQQLLKGDGCSFAARITADYGDAIHSFSVSCQGDSQGNVRFQVTEPETIAGITGRISDDGGQLTFDDTALCFDLLTDRQLSPVSAPWIFLRTLRAGYLEGAGMDGSLNRVAAGDSYQEDALHVDFWLNGENLPVRGEILFENRRILTLELSDFQILSK